VDAGTALDIATAAAVVFGVIFGLAEVRQIPRDRRDHAAVDIVGTVQTQKFAGLSSAFFGFRTTLIRTSSAAIRTCSMMLSP
jgi:hypothetical protein